MPEHQGLCHVCCAQHCAKQHREGDRKKRKQIMQIQTMRMCSCDTNYDKGINHERSTEARTHREKQRLDGRAASWRTRLKTVTLKLTTINLKEMSFCSFRAKEQTTLRPASHIFLLLNFVPLTAKLCL